MVVCKFMHLEAVRKKKISSLSGTEDTSVIQSQGVFIYLFSI